MKYLKHKTRPATRKMGKLWDRLVEVGFSDFTLWWQPIGPMLEMFGQSGGYMMQTADGWLEPLGLTLEHSLAHVDVYVEYVNDLRPGSLKDTCPANTELAPEGSALTASSRSDSETSGHPI